MKQYYTSHRSGLKAKYNHLKRKIERSLQNGRFYQYTKQRQQQLLGRLHRYYARLRRMGQLALPTAALVLGGSSLLEAQIFTEITTTANPFVELGSVNAAAPFGLVDVGRLSTPSFVDIDGDGDLDAFVGENNGSINYFENTSTDSSIPAFRASTSASPFGLTNVGINAAPSFVDIDGDGDLDAFVGEFDGNINYFENTSTNSSIPAFSLSTNTAPFGLTDVGRNAKPSFVDIDGDGDLDAFVGEFDGNINYFENTTTDSTIPAFSLSNNTTPFGLTDVRLSSAPNFGDIDGDGDLDAFVGEYDGNINYFKNTSTDSSIPAFSLSNDTTPFVLTDVGTNSAPSFVDIDRDGDLDAFIGESDGNINYFENVGNNTSANFVLPVPDVEGNAVPSLVDIDGDGDFDAFVGASDGTITYFENTSTDSSVPAFTASTSSDPFGLIDVGRRSAPSFVDIDGDGDLDAFVGDYDGFISYFENVGNTQQQPFFRKDNSQAPFGLIRTPYTYYASPTFVDIDGDGDLDAFVGEAYGNINYFENTRDSRVPAFSLSTDSTPFGLTNVGSDSAPSFADIDGDGDLDAFIGEENGNINYFENTSTNGSVPAFRFSNDSEPFGLTDVGDYAAPSFADIDGDGDLDAFIGEGDGNVNYFENNSAQRSTAVETVTLDETFSCPENTTLTYATTNLGSGISACDLDGDAIYAASVLPTGQGVSAAVVGTGANDCELMVEISLTNNVLPDDYTISLAIEDPDGVSNSSGTSSAINSAGTVLSLNLGTFEVQGCGIIVDAISIATPIVSRNQTATFLNVDLESDGCDANGNAIYSTLISPNTPQSPIINVVGTGAGDCEFTVEVITDSNTAPADYDISLVIEDPDGVNNESAVGSVSGSTSTFVTFEPQALSVVPTASPVVEVSDITINNNRSCQDETTTFSTVTLTTDQCDFDGDAIYTATIVPAGQGVTAAVVGTGADDCSFTVEITTSASATPDEYAVNLVVEDADGVSNTSAQTNVIQTNNQSISYNLGTFKVLGDVDVTTIYGAEVVAANSVSDFAVNILNTNPNTTYIWTVDGTALTTMIGDGDHTGSPQNIDIGSGNSVNVSAVTIAVADNITQSVLTIDNPQDGPMQDITFSLQATNPCGVDTEMATTAVTILPVELLYFKATAQATSTLLTWETAFEQNNDYFSIERSYDARTFEPIGQVQGVGTSIQAQQYEFIDRTVDVSQEQVYYRLRQVDYDQSYMYTDIKVVAFAQDEVFLELSPNPTSNQLVIKNGMGKANITNALGQVVKTFVIDSTVFTLDVSALASGQYILTVEQWNGTIAIEQFVK